MAKKVVDDLSTNERIFVDRENAQDFFNEHKIKANSKDEHFVICYYGEGGVGKTELCTTLMETLAKEKGSHYLLYDFNSESTSCDVNEALRKMRNMLVSKYPEEFEFPLFDIAFLAYEKANGNINDLTPRTIDSFFGNGNWLDTGLFVMGMIPVVNTVTQLIQAADSAIKNGKVTIKKLNEKKYLAQYEKCIKDIENCQDNTDWLQKNLVRYFAKDFDYCCNNLESPFILFLDTFEIYTEHISKRESCDENEDWLQQLIAPTSNVLYALFSRSECLMEDTENYQLEYLAHDDAIEMLEKGGIHDQNLREKIYEVTGGHPLFLAICLENYNSFIRENHGNVPTIDDVDQDKNKMIARFYKYLDNDSQYKRIVETATVARTWTDDEMESICQASFGYNYDCAKYQKLLRSSLVKKSGDIRYIQEIVRKVIIEYITDPKKNIGDKNHYRNIVQAISNYYDAVIDSWNDVVDFSENLLISYAELVEEAINTESDQNQLDKYLTCLGAVTHMIADCGTEKDIQKNISIYEQVLPKSRAVLGSNHPATLTAMDNLSMYYYYLNGQENLQKAIEIEQQVVAVRKEILGEKNNDTLTSMNNLAGYVAMTGEKDDLQYAADLLEQVLIARKEILGENNSDTITSMNNLAGSYVGLGGEENIQKAISLTEKALEAAKANDNVESSDQLSMMNNLAGYYTELDGEENLQKAVCISEKVLHAREKSLGENHPDTLMTMSTLAEAYSNFGDKENLQKAISLDEKVMDSIASVMGEGHPNTLLVMGNLAAYYSEMGGVEYLQKAVSLGERLVAASESSLGDEDINTLAAINKLANAYSHLGGSENLQKAVSLGERLVAASESSLGDEDINTRVAINRLIYAYVHLGGSENLQKAVSLGERLVAASESSLGDEDFNTLTAMNGLAYSYAQLGGRDNLQKAVEIEEKIVMICKETLGDNDQRTLNFTSILNKYYEMVQR